MIWVLRWSNWRLWKPEIFRTHDEYSQITCFYWSVLSICWRPYYDRDL